MNRGRLFDTMRAKLSIENESSNSMSRSSNLKKHNKEEAIVSSEHLASAEGWQLSELEFGMTISYNAFSRWITRCMSAAGYPDFSPLEVLVLHNINHRHREKRLVDICFMLNVEDQHTVNYALKKLDKAGLILRTKRGKEIFYSASQTGIDACLKYRRVREQCLMESINAMEGDPDELSHNATLLRMLSGLYDQAARAATSL